MSTGSGSPVVALGSGVIAGVGGGALVSQLPVTGANTVVQLALYTSAALIAWGIGYVTYKKVI